MSEEYLFTLYAVDLFFYKNNIGEIDIKRGFVDGTNDGGIDFIYSDNETLYLIQGKSSNSLSMDDIKNVFHKMFETVDNFDKKKYDKYSALLKSIYINAYDDLTEDKNIEFVLFTNTRLNERVKNQIAEFSKSETLQRYTIAVYDYNDIEYREACITQDSDLIKEGSIDIYLESNKNMLCYGKDGLIVSTKASSIKKLYDKFAKIGLFSYNLREHITQKTVDDAIDKTIKEDRNNFWFYNNGITIACNDFIIDGNKIKLYGFSIINGAQTTTKVGKSRSVNEKTDFAIVCKIVRAKGTVDNDDEFISKISEASNSQKPIRARDLKANASEQKILQMRCAKNGERSLAIEIKRGVKPKNYNKVERWQRITNEFIGQLIYACLLQRPGPARNGKHHIFSSEKIYSLVFRCPYNCDTLYDLVCLNNYYEQFSQKKLATESDIDNISIINNGKLTVLAVVTYLYKKYKNIVDNRFSENLHNYNIQGTIISRYKKDDLEDKIYGMFTFIVRELKRLYESKKEILKITSCSNFFKSEPIYDEVILEDFDNLDEWDQDKLANYMTIFDS